METLLKPKSTNKYEISSKLDPKVYYKVRILNEGTEVKTIDEESFMVVRAEIMEGSKKGTWMTTFLRLDNLPHIERLETALKLNFSEALSGNDSEVEILDRIKVLIKYQEFYVKPYIRTSNNYNGESRYNISSFGMLNELPQTSKITTDV